MGWRPIANIEDVAQEFVIPSHTNIPPKNYGFQLHMFETNELHRL